MNHQKNISKNKILSLVKNAKNKKFAIFSLGCRSNQAEILQLAAWLESLGFREDKKHPYLILINTCAVTQKGFGESRRQVKSLRRKYPRSKIVVIGCGVTFSPSSFNKADLLINNTQKELLLKEYFFPPSPDSIEHSFPSSHRLLLRIQTGCNHFCSYCIVPYLRSTLISLPPSRVISFIKKGEELGYQEVVLTGTNLALYGKGEGFSLEQLVKLILKETTIPRISFGSINPNNFTPSFVNLLFSDWSQKKPRINRYLHIPLQSGSDLILKRMNRPYRSKEYRHLIKSLTKNQPYLAVGTDIIVGFPGEGEKEFNETLSFIKDLPLARLHVFRYSSRKGTLAQKKEKEWGIVPEKEKQRRSYILRKLGEEKAQDFRQKMKGKILPVLFLEKNKKGEWLGLTDNYLLIKTKKPQNLKGKIKKMKIS